MELDSPPLVVHQVWILCSDLIGKFKKCGPGLGTTARLETAAEDNIGKSNIRRCFSSPKNGTTYNMGSKRPYYPGFNSQWSPYPAWSKESAQGKPEPLSACWSHKARVDYKTESWSLNWDRVRWGRTVPAHLSLRPSLWLPKSYHIGHFGVWILSFSGSTFLFVSWSWTPSANVGHPDHHRGTISV